MESHVQVHDGGPGPRCSRAMVVMKLEAVARAIPQDANGTAVCLQEQQQRNRMLSELHITDFPLVMRSH